MMDADAGVVKLPVKECQGFKATTASKEEANEDLTESLRGTVALLIPDFKLASRVERAHFHCFNPPHSW